MRPLHRATGSNHVPVSNKRKSAGPIPPAKKQRSSDHDGQGNDFLRNQPVKPSSTPIIPADTLPSLPPISPEYETAVFTHQSMLSATENHKKLACYDRLEFLGDAYIEIIASRLIWNLFSDLPTSRLSYIREGLVKNETLAGFSVAYGLDRRLKVQQGLVDALGNAAWTKIKGDVFEAYVAAVTLSDSVNGFAKAEEWLSELWMPQLRKVQTTTTDLTAKQELAKKILAGGVKINYVDEKPMVLEKKAGLQTYFVGCYLTGWGWENQHLASATGTNRVVAGNEAATKALQNRPLIDEIIAKKQEWMKAKEAERTAQGISNGAG